MLDGVFWLLVILFIVLLTSGMRRFLDGISKRMSKNTTTVCRSCGEGYVEWNDPRGQLCLSCSNDMGRQVPHRLQIDTANYSYGKKRPHQFDTCGHSVKKEHMRPSMIYPHMLLCNECFLDETEFIKPLNKSV